MKYSDLLKAIDNLRALAQAPTDDFVLVSVADLRTLLYTIDPMKYQKWQRLVALQEVEKQAA